MRSRKRSARSLLVPIVAFALTSQVARADAEAVVLWKLTVPNVRFSDLAFSPDGKSLVGGTDAGLCRFFDVVDGKTVLDLPAVDGRAISVLAFSPDGSLLAEGQSDGHVVIIDVASGRSKYVGALPEPAIALRFSDDGARLVACGRSGALASWNADGTQPQILDALEEAPVSQEILPDGARCLAAMQDGRVLVRTCGAREASSFSIGTQGAVGIGVSADGSRWAFGLSTRSLVEFDAATQKELRRWPIPGEPVEITYSRDATAVLAAPRTPPAGRAKVMLCNVRDSAPPQPVETTQGNIRKLEFHPDGARFGTLSKDSRIVMMRQLTARNPLPPLQPTEAQRAAAATWRAWIGLQSGDGN